VSEQILNGSTAHQHN